MCIKLQNNGMHLSVIIPNLCFGVLWSTKNHTSFEYSSDGSNFLVILGCCLAYKMIPEYTLWENIFGDKVMNVEWGEGKQVIVGIDIWAGRRLTDFLVQILKDLKWSGDLPEEEDLQFQSSVLLTNCT